MESRKTAAAAARWSPLKRQTFEQKTTATTCYNNDDDDEEEEEEEDCDGEYGDGDEMAIMAAVACFNTFFVWANYQSRHHTRS